ncbi:hypothetical protein V6Z11_D05G209400 [Gossypium hirsutum]
MKILQPIGIDHESITLMIRPGISRTYKSMVNNTYSPDKFLEICHVRSTTLRTIKARTLLKGKRNIKISPENPRKRASLSILSFKMRPKLKFEDRLVQYYLLKIGPSSNFSFCLSFLKKLVYF